MMNRNRILVALGSVTALFLPTIVHAGSVDLAGGWRAQWDPALDGFVDIQDNGSIGGATLFQKTAEFTQGSVGGVFPSIQIQFIQTGPNADSTFVILDEIVTNSTGEDWTDFHLDLTGADAEFDPAATAASPGPLPIGWAIAPFQQAQFANGNTRLDIFDGVVANGSQWFPGGGGSDGDLFFTVTPGDGINTFATFVLTETPTPEPATAVLLMTGALAVCFRRRN